MGTFKRSRNKEALPAASAALTETRLPPNSSVALQVKFEPVTVAGAPLHVTPPTRPDSESDTVPLIVTLPADTVAPSCGEVTAIAGRVLSMFSVTLTCPVFPLASRAVPVATWPIPSVVTTIGAGQLWTGALAAVQVKDTVAVQLFQPAALGAGQTEAVIAGG